MDRKEHKNPFLTADSHYLRVRANPREAFASIWRKWVSRRCPRVTSQATGRSIGWSLSDCWCYLCPFLQLQRGYQLPESKFIISCKLKKNGKKERKKKKTPRSVTSRCDNDLNVHQGFCMNSDKNHLMFFSGSFSKWLSIWVTLSCISHHPLQRYSSLWLMPFIWTGITAGARARRLRFLGHGKHLKSPRTHPTSLALDSSRWAVKLRACGMCLTVKWNACLFVCVLKKQVAQTKELLEKTTFTGLTWYSAKTRGFIIAPSRSKK